MKSRCANPSNKDYSNYGERGITVCEEWKNNFKTFYDWATKTGYEKGLTIERIDVNGNYCPENCKWIPNPIQARNLRKTRLFTYNGETKDIRSWSEQYGVPYYVLRSRLVNYNWPIERALFEGVRN